MTFSHNGKYRATIVNNDARPVVSILETATNAPVPLPAVPNASVRRPPLLAERNEAITLDQR